MSEKLDLWKVHTFGEKGKSFEVSIMRESYAGGHSSWGWFGPNKINMSQIGDFDACVAFAEKLVRLLNDEIIKTGES